MGYAFGDWVEHPEYGRGIVVCVSGDGACVAYKDNSNLQFWVRSSDLTPIDSPQVAALQAEIEYLKTNLDCWRKEYAYAWDNSAALLCAWQGVCGSSATVFPRSAQQMAEQIKARYEQQQAALRQAREALADIRQFEESLMVSCEDDVTCVCAFCLGRAAISAIDAALGEDSTPPPTNALTDVPTGTTGTAGL